MPCTHETAAIVNIYIIMHRIVCGALYVFPNIVSSTLLTIHSITMNYEYFHSVICMAFVIEISALLVVFAFIHSTPIIIIVLHAVVFIIS